MYVPEFWLSTTEGLQAPVIPFVDGLGKVGTVPPAQIVRLVPKLNAGVMIGLTVTINVNGNAHSPDVGVNVYVPLVRLSATDGLQVPVIPFVDVVGNVGTVPPAQIVRFVPKLKSGVTFGLTVTINKAVVPHCPAPGVNVYVPLP